MFRIVAALLLALPLAAGHPSSIEDSNFLPESGVNRSNAVLQYNAFRLGDATAWELAQEWATSSPRHQFSFVVPIYDDGETGLGDVAVSYRYQLFGSEASRTAIAPRVSLLLPTRSEHFGGPNSGLQVNVPVTLTLHQRLVSHTSAGATWYREARTKELQVAQSVAFAMTDRISLLVDAAWTRCDGEEHLLVVRPGVQIALEGPGGMQVAPGIAFPLGTDAGGVLLYVAFEHPFGK